MKKLLSVVIALMMMVTFVFAEEAAPAEVKTLYAGVLTVGCEAGYPPFEMVADDGESVVGLDMDIMGVIPISGMIAGNAMVAVGLCYNNLGQRFSSEQQQLQEKLSLGATPKVASARLIRDSIRSSLIPTVDSAKTVGLVSLPGMMSGLIFAGIDPVKAIKYQIMVTFMLLSTASLSTIIACYLTYRKFYNARHQLVVTQLKKTG